MMLGLSTLGLRVYDVMRGYDYLRTRSDVGEIHLHGVGSGAVFAFFAAVLEEGFSTLTCEEMLASYREVCCTPNYQLPFFNLKSMAYGLLQIGDFDDFLPALAPRSVSFVRPRNAHGEILV